MDPLSAEAFARRGDAYSGKGLFDRAIADLDTSIGLDPSHDSGFASRGFAHSRRGNVELARRDFQEAVRLNPKNSYARDALNQLGATTAPNATLAPAGPNKRIALVIGNSAYERKPPLRNPKNDARDVAAALTRLGRSEERRVGKECRL